MGLFRKIANKIAKPKGREIEVEREVQLDSSSKTNNTSEMIYCRFCGTANSQEQDVCSKCGSRLNVPPSTIMKACTKCGLAANDDSIYCTRCRARFEDL
ncbi:MAG TPA: zinc ribbon domain-containing protein [Nitrososphaeraceae archaeon]|jgi:RNA polymerase subunit RPABC4/transcription elongation factor Spt4|nr:zinc ribbon domain-containing protein [Nitrososphaeraceae archaeon]